MAISTILTYLQAPLLAILFLVYLKQKFQLKTTKYLFQAFAFGLLSVIIFIAADLVMELFGLDTLKSLKRSVFYSFVVIGFSSQIGIFIVLRYIFLKKRHFKGPVDGIIYAIIIALGFGTAAVPLYAAGFFAAVPADLFLYTLPLALLLFGIVMGFFTGMGKFRKNRLIDSLTGLGTSSFFMGFYYFAFLTKEDTILILFGIGIIIMSGLFAVKAINTKPESSKTSN